MAQEDIDGILVIRRLLALEVQHKFHGRHYKVRSPIPAEHPLAMRWYGNSCNANMLCGNLDLLWRHVRPICTARPTHIEQLVAPGTEQKVLDLMRKEQRRFEQVQAGKRPTEAEHLVIEQPIPDERFRNAYWYLGDYNRTQNMEDVKTVQEMERPPATVNVDWVCRLALNSHDKQIAGILADGVDPGNELQQPMVVCHNQVSALAAHRLVTKCHHEENEAGRNRFWRPDFVRKTLGHDGSSKKAIVWDAAASSRRVVNFVPFIATPQGAVPKTLANGTVDPDNCRPTANFSCPLPHQPLAVFITAPNDLISLDDLPPFRWFGLGEFFAQVHYLSQFGVQLELSKWDLQRYYRAFRMLAQAIPSHMQLWLDDDSPFLITDWRMMFGCRAAANIASRASVFICWLVRFAIRHV